jgi:hypothetical protein
MGIYEKLTRIQTEIKAPKNLYNSFGKYHYRNAESICESVKPFLVKEKCNLVITDDIVLIGERFYVKAIVTLTDNEDGSSISVSALARESDEKKGMDSSQVTGATSSYARKYALNGLFLLDDTKDADTDEFANQTANQPQEKPKTAKTTKGYKETPQEAKLNEEMRASVDPVYLVAKDGKATDEQRAKMHSEMERTGVAEEVIKDMFSVSSLDELNGAQIVSILNKFKITGDKK